MLLAGQPSASITTLPATEARQQPQTNKGGCVPVKLHRTAGLPDTRMCFSPQGVPPPEGLAPATPPGTRFLATGVQHHPPNRCHLGHYLWALCTYCDHTSHPPQPTSLVYFPLFP